MKKFKDVVEMIDYEDLLRLKYDLENGGLTIKEILKSRIEQEQKKHESFCSFCQNKIELKSVNTFTLIFGPHDFRKKATFCAHDCLEYFMNQLKAKSIPKKETLDYGKTEDNTKINC